MALPASDNFNRSNGGLGANWTDANGTAGILIETNVVKADAGVDALAYWNADSFSGDQKASMTVTTVGDSFLGPAVRVTASNGYGFYGGQFGRYLFKVVAGVTSTLSSDGTSVSVSDVLELQVVGTQLTAKVNGADLFTPTDSALSSGSGGASSFGSANALRQDDWTADNIGGASVPYKERSVARGLNRGIDRGSI